MLLQSSRFGESLRTSVRHSRHVNEIVERRGSNQGGRRSGSNMSGGARKTIHQIMVARFAVGVAVRWLCILQREMWGKISGAVPPFPSAVPRRSTLKCTWAASQVVDYWVVICQSNKYMYLSA